MSVHRIAVTVLLLVSLSACAARPSAGATTPPPGPAPVVASSSELDAVAYRAAPEGPQGVIAPVDVSVRPNTSGHVRVAVFEEMSGGAGDMWRAAVWVAAVHATTVLGRPLHDYEISVSAGGLIDGPSAGALITAGLIATMQGVPVRPDVTMTGTVNPDGTVGPVGGIQHKLRAAARAGKRAFGYPRGARFEVDPEGGDPVDLRALGAELDIATYEIADIEDAYGLLTGYTIPRVAAVPSDLMVPSPLVEEQMRAQIGAWGTVVRDGLADYQQQPPAVQQLLRADAQQTIQYWEDAERYLRQGLVATAYKRARDAAVYGNNLPLSARMLVHVVTYDVEALLSEAESLGRIDDDVDAYFAALDNTQPRTVGDALTLLSAYDYGLQARSAAAKGRTEHARAAQLLHALGEEDSPSPERVEEVAGQAGVALAAAGSWYNTTRLLLTIGKDGVDLDLGRTTTVPLDVGRLMDLAQSTAIAARAVHGYYEAVTVQQLAEQARLSLSEARARLILADTDYRNATLMVTVAVSHREPGDVHEALLALAAAERAFVDSSFLMMRDYSIGAVRDGSGQVVRVQNDLALIHALESADVRARQSAARAATRVGRIPDDAAVIYERSRMLREGTLDERLASLRGMWSAAVISRTAGHIARLP